MSKYNKKEIIFSDLDSTLLNDDGFFSNYTKETVKNLYKDGYIIVPITARSTEDVMRQAKRLELDKLGGIIGANNGSQIFDFKNNVWILDEALPRNIVEEVFNDTYKKYTAKVHFFGDETTYVYAKGHNSVYWAKMMGSDYVIVDDVKKITSRINHLTIILRKNISHQEAMEFYENVLQKYINQGVDVHKYTDRVYEVCPKNINKGNAVKTVLKYLNIEDDVKTYAFGDGENDISMFDVVDTGVAMQNAITELKDVADDMTTTNENDGVAKYIHTHILNK